MGAAWGMVARDKGIDGFAEEQLHEVRAANQIMICSRSYDDAMISCGFNSFCSQKSNPAGQPLRRVELGR